MFLDFNPIVTDDLAYMVFFNKFNSKSILLTLDSKNKVCAMSKSIFEYSLASMTEFF